MQTTTFYFVRHGETEYNRRGIVQGRGIDARLNATGRKQAVAVAHRLADVSFNAIYTSPLRRAVETMEAIAMMHADVPVYQVADLEEMAWGIYEGEPHTPRLQQVFAGYRARWRQGEFHLPVEGGESIRDVQVRAERAVATMLDRHAGQTVLVVTHGRFLRVLLSTVLEEYGLERMEEIEHTNTGVNTLCCREGCFEAVRLNCVAHLEAARDAA